MATLHFLKQALRERVYKVSGQPLSDTQYTDGFETVIKGSGGIYKEFIIPQLSHLFAQLDTQISFLEIGPGPKSILGCLPKQQRRIIKKYTAFEPNSLHAAKLEDWLGQASEGELPLPCLEDGHDVRQSPLPGAGGVSEGETFNVILFCHSLYGMGPKRDIIKRALEMLVDRPGPGIVVVFHRDHTLQLDGLVSHHSASLPTGTITVPDEDGTLDSFASFIAGFVVTQKALQAEWRAVCRALSHRGQPGYLLFRSPEAMISFIKSADTLPELAAQVPLLSGHRMVKNREARLHCPAAVVLPTEVEHVQQCVRWALKQRVSLTVIGGGHSSHCLWANVVSIDMAAFNRTHVHAVKELELGFDSDLSPCVVAGTGCKTEDIIRSTMAVGLTVPLGSRPSVGAGLWLQGGIGHQARLYGLTCDAIIGAVIVSVKTGQILGIGHVPSEHWPPDAVRPKDETDLLWALKGAGTNIGIVISVTFRAFPAQSHLVRNWVIPINSPLEAQNRLSRLDYLTSKLPRHCSADAYLHWDNGELQLGVTVFETLTAESSLSTPLCLFDDLGPPDSSQTVNAVGLFDCEMYMSRICGGHGKGKTSSFKRCVFLKNIGKENIAGILVAAIKVCPLPLCYLHLLQGGGAVRDVSIGATAFGSRDWDYACVITGVWPRDQDMTDISYRTVQWVYDVARDLLRLSNGVYGADLGPDPRDACLATKAFGPNGPRLAAVKQGHDPHGVLVYACPVPKIPTTVILVTGPNCSGKDYCASIWASSINANANKGITFTARVASISDATKRAYAVATGSDLDRLLQDRAYKEQHRMDLTDFYQGQVQCRPQLPEEHFLSVVGGMVDTDVLFVTGMRDEAPAAVFSRLVPNTRLIEVNIAADEGMWRAGQGSSSNDRLHDSDRQSETTNVTSNATALDYQPSFVFHNNVRGSGAAEKFAERWLAPFFHADLQRLADMIRLVPDFPRSGVDFRHVLNIAQQRGGLKLCVSLLQTHFTGDWSKVDSIACCQAAGFVIGSALSMQVNIPLVLIRERGKLPPPTASVLSPGSHISSVGSHDGNGRLIELEEGLLSRDASVVVLDDVLASGRTLCAVLQLLNQVGISSEKTHVIVVAEFPAHGGRGFLRKQGFKRVNIQSLLVLGGF
ncbi:hypothetical protein BJY01DRAFT_260368 [Aspergillus pseudoustus]|uniref:FAD-binding PCMH-type domain-containing protein n=1 Tax=Aspergillus pseudoustus TaxID=1810923 RepID=A0ABR4IW66_9EURO